MQFCDNKPDKKFNLGIDRYDILILLLDTFKMRYYTPLYSKIYIWPISGDCPFLSGQKTGSGWSKKLAHKMFVFLRPLRAITKFSVCYRLCNGPSRGELQNFGFAD